MAPVGIVGIGSYVPPKEMSNEDWAKIVDTSDDWISTKTGMKKRRIADPSVCTSDWQSRHRRSPSKIRGLLLRTSTW